MKKKLLFIIPSLEIGGAEKSLVGLLGGFDFDKYEVDLFLLKTGALYNRVPHAVNIILPGKKYADFTKNILASCLSFFVKLQWPMIWHRLMFTISTKQHEKGRGEQYSWKHQRKAIGRLPKKYDVAVGYLEKTSIYCCVDLVDARKKIGFVRADYSSLNLDKEFDRGYFRKLDALCANGELSLQILKREFPEFQDKMKLIKNVSFPSQIEALSKQPVSDYIRKDGWNIVSVGRLDKAKGYDLAIEACAILQRKNFVVQWHVIGEGPERGYLLDLANKRGIESDFHLLGSRENPYPYIAAADMFVQTSRNEGKSNTVEEAKMLCKPIVVTDFESVFEQIEDEVTGLIVPKDPSEIANAIIKLAGDAERRERFKTNLKMTTDRSSSALDAFYHLIEI